jgi:predicted GNAT family acetyltransferase
VRENSGTDKPNGRANEPRRDRTGTAEANRPESAARSQRSQTSSNPGIRVLTPFTIANASYKKQKRNSGVTEIVEMPNRGHALTIDDGWREGRTDRAHVHQAVRLAGDRGEVQPSAGSGSAARPNDAVVVRDNPARRRYDAYVGSALAGFTDYHVQPGIITVMHTEIERSFEGRGMASQFVAAILDIRRREAEVLVVRPFVRSFLQRHPMYADLVWKP